MDAASLSSLAGRRPRDRRQPPPRRRRSPSWCLTVGVAKALLWSDSVKIVVVWLPGAPAVGVKTRLPSSSPVTVAAEPASV